MAEPRGYALSPEFAQRVEDSVAWTEERSVNGPPPKNRRPNVTQQNIQRIRITSDEPQGSLAGVDYYPGRCQLFEPSTGLWLDLTPYDAVVVFDTTADSDGSSSHRINSAATSTAFANGDEIWAKLVATVTLGSLYGSSSADDEEEWPAFAAISNVSHDALGGGEFWAILTESPCTEDDCEDPNCAPQGYGWVQASTDGCGHWQEKVAPFPVLGVTYGTTCQYQALEVNGLFPVIAAGQTVVRLSRTPIIPGFLGTPTYSFEYPSAPAGCVGNCVDGITTRTQRITLRYTEDDGMGGCCTREQVIDLPVWVDVCVKDCT